MLGSPRLNCFSDPHSVEVLTIPTGSSNCIKHALNSALSPGPLSLRLQNTPLGHLKFLSLYSMPLIRFILAGNTTCFLNINLVRWERKHINCSARRTCPYMVMCKHKITLEQTAPAIIRMVPSGSYCHKPGKSSLCLLCLISMTYQETRSSISFSHFPHIKNRQRLAWKQISGTLPDVLWGFSWLQCLSQFAISCN